jgi:preprotein translocase subunit SecB
MSEEEQNFSIARIYTKDLSLESPRAPQIFEKQWNPKLGLEVDVLNEKLNDTLYEVILKLGVTVKTEDEVAFLVEIQQAGVFVLRGFDEQTIEHILGSMCPNILFPYARETIDSLAVKATFPAPMLAPINFDAFMEQRKKPETN